MSDDRVISLDDRRDRQEAPITAVATVTNDLLKIPFSRIDHELRWTFTATAKVDGEGERPIDASFVAIALDDETPMGWASRNEHSLAAEFVVGHDYAAMIQSVATSPVPFEIIVAFAADKSGSIRSMTLSVSRKQPA